MCVAIRSRNQRSCEITTAQPAKSSSASSSARSVSTSRSFVGSSSSSRLPPQRRSFARWTRFRSPPERSPTRFCWSEPLKLNQRDVLARVHLALAELDRVVAAGDLLPDGVLRVEVGARLVDVGELDRVADAQRRRCPAAPRPRSSGTASSCRRRSGRSTPTMPPGGSEKVMSSTSRRSPKPFETPSASTTTSPSRGPAGMWISTRSSLTFCSSASSRSYAPRRAFDFAWRAFGLSAHPLELAGERAAARRLLLLLDGEPRLLLLEPGRSSCPRTGCPCRGRARGSSRRRCRGSSGRG